MSQLQIGRNADLKKLRDEGYEITIIDGYLVVCNVPYVNAQKTICTGTIVSSLVLAGDETQPNIEDHTVYFIGEYPCDHFGKPIEAIRNQSADTQLSEGLRVQHRFSSKLQAGQKYKDYHHKMTRYVEILEHPAKAIDPSVSARTFKPIEDASADPVFKYIDTASSRADIVAISDKLSGMKIAIIGLGGTGSYVLDFVAKTPVKEIHLFDGDIFSQHNAFRSPGAPSIEELREKRSKVAFHDRTYSKMRYGIVAHEQMLHESNCDQLAGMDFVFLCIDAGPAKRAIIEIMETLDVPFVDTGIGMLKKDDSLFGNVTLTMNTPAKRDHFRTRVSLAEAAPDALYSKNIQVAELNAMNAALAVIKWKKFFGYYEDSKHEHFSVYMLQANALINEDISE